MIKLMMMQERTNSIEKLPLNQAAKEIGQIFSQSPDIYQLTEIKEPYEITRIGKASAVENIPLSHQHKKHLFWATIEGQKAVIIHFSGELYCQDPDYFRRVYQESRNFYGGQSSQFTDKKLGPSLLGCDDETMTLIIERAVHDLSAYFSSEDKEKVQAKVKAAIEFLKNVWEKSKERNDKLPRYVSAFLEPEYSFLKGKKPEDYLKDRATIALYKQTQEELEASLRQLEGFDFKRGFGLPDVKPANLVEDEEGNILFIDVAKSEFAYHWLTQVGQFYQGAVKEAPNSPFSQVLKQEAIQLIKSASQPDLAVKLFTLGRMNRFLINCSLRNIVYTTEIGRSIDKRIIINSLIWVRDLIKADSVEEAVK